jgi:hypothetical protein
MNTCPELGQAHAGRQLALDEGLGKAESNSHHLAGRLHFGPENGIDAAELGEGKNRFLDREIIRDHFLVTPWLASDCPTMQRAAIFASCSPVALETKGTVRDARGLTSRTKTTPSLDRELDVHQTADLQPHGHQPRLPAQFVLQFGRQEYGGSEHAESPE